MGQLTNFHVVVQEAILDGLWMSLVLNARSTEKLKVVGDGPSFFTHRERGCNSLNILVLNPCMNKRGNERSPLEASLLAGK